MLLRATRFGDLRCRTLSWCRSTRTSASNAARDRNSPIKAHQINLQRSLIDGTINRFAGLSQLLWVCGRDKTIDSTKPASMEADSSFNAASDWADSCVITIRRQRERGKRLR
jgi:hypothetical protein